jgi:hypothetical protein
LTDQDGPSDADSATKQWCNSGETAYIAKPSQRLHGETNPSLAAAPGVDDNNNRHRKHNANLECQR